MYYPEFSVYCGIGLRGYGEDMVGVEGRKNITNIYCMKRYISIIEIYLFIVYNCILLSLPLLF